MRAHKLIKRILLALLAIVLVLVLVYWDIVAYGARQGYGQLNIVWKARPVTEFLEDPNFPDSLKQRLRFIDEVRK